MSEKTIDEIIRIPMLERGDKIYHYTLGEGLQGICENKEFWATERGFLNDYSEFTIATDVFCCVVDKNVNNQAAGEVLKRKVRSTIDNYSKIGKVDETVAFGGDYVISLSLERDSSLMWSEFSGFNGYCLTFDFYSLYESFKNNYNSLHGKVIYDTEQQIAMMEDTINENILRSIGFPYFNQWEDLEKMTDVEMEELAQFITLIVEVYNMFFKKACFAGEKEYRIVFLCGHDGGLYKESQLDIPHFRVKNDLLIPYVKKEITGIDALQSIVIGPMNKSDIALKGLQFFLRNQKLDIPIERSSVPLRY